jgi:hypothetical protein
MSLPADALFGWQATVTVDDLDLSGFDLAFQVTRTLKPKTPNTCELRLYNLSRSLRRELASKVKADGSIFVSLAAGYRGRLSQIFRGDLRDVFSMREDTGWVTTISSGDGEQARRTARIRRAFPPGTKVEVMLRALSDSLGVGLGNSAQALVGPKRLLHGSSEFVTGAVAHGNSAELLTDLLNSVGMEWSVQDGELQVLDKGRALAGEAVLLTPATGLIGSPEPGHKGTVRATSLLIPGLFPGALVRIESEEVEATFRLERVDYSGSTSDDDWSAHLQGREAKT